MLKAYSQNAAHKIIVKLTTGINFTNEQLLWQFSLAKILQTQTESTKPAKNTLM
jgi:hypothetical protein